MIVVLFPVLHAAILAWRRGDPGPRAFEGQGRKTGRGKPTEFRRIWYFPVPSPHLLLPPTHPRPLLLALTRFFGASEFRRALLGDFKIVENPRLIGSRGGLVDQCARERRRAKAGTMRHAAGISRMAVSTSILASVFVVSNIAVDRKQDLPAGLDCGGGRKQEKLAPAVGRTPLIDVRRGVTPAWEERAVDDGREEGTRGDGGRGERAGSGERGEKGERERGRGARSKERGEKEREEREWGGEGARRGDGKKGRSRGREGEREWGERERGERER
ncbi:hypothetical protein B0H12DRAFT_1082416 [Mycena haematopus]|nr:hypothetical protein B0H12DRAFT_1082416 [Mycena haematopus]